MAGDCSETLLQWSIYFIDISSSSLLFVIYLCSSTIPFELGSGSSVGRETPKFLGFELRKCKRQAHFLTFLLLSDHGDSYIPTSFLIWRSLWIFILGMSL